MANFYSKEELQQMGFKFIGGGGKCSDQPKGKYLWD